MFSKLEPNEPTPAQFFFTDLSSVLRPLFSAPVLCWQTQDTMNFIESAGNEPPRSPNNPNKRILRKLWLRMTEGDYRTKLKALQILHHTTMDLSSEANGR